MSTVRSYIVLLHLHWSVKKIQKIARNFLKTKFFTNVVITLFWSVAIVKSEPFGQSHLKAMLQGWVIKNEAIIILLDVALITNMFVATEILSVGLPHDDQWWRWWQRRWRQWQSPRFCCPPLKWFPVVDLWIFSSPVVENLIELPSLYSCLP